MIFLRLKKIDYLGQAAKFETTLRKSFVFLTKLAPVQATLGLACEWGFWHAVPRRVLARQLWSGRSVPVRHGIPFARLLFVMLTSPPHMGFYYNPLLVAVRGLGGLVACALWWSRRRTMRYSISDFNVREYFVGIATCTFILIDMHQYRVHRVD